MKKLYIVVSLLMIFSFLLSGCAKTPVASTDKLAEILARGTLIVSTDPAYPPQSELVENAAPLPNTKCTGDQKTANEMVGFDIDVAVAIANKLGVEACFLTVDWSLITAGNWANRWDLSIGSMTITPERMTKLYFTQPYYTTPAAFFVHTDNSTFTQPSDLSGKKVGSCSGCTYDAYLTGALDIPPLGIIPPVVQDIQYSGYDTDLPALQDLALGDGIRLDGVLTAGPTGAGAINDGLPIKQLGEPVFFEYLGGAIDKAGTPDPIPFVEKVTEIIQGLHTDGTLSTLTQKYYGEDLSAAASSYDWAALKQFP
jgi:polar amino acid transport system substrate-binding protein